MARIKTSTDLKILEILMFEPMSQYAIHKEIKMHYRTILRHIKELEEQKRVKNIDREPSSKGGIEKNIYGLTTAGLVEALTNFSDTVKDWDKVAQVNANLLTYIFGKWNLFKEKNFTKSILILLKEALLQLKNRDLTSLTESEISNYITRRVFFGLEWSGLDKGREDLVKNLLPKDRDLKDFTDNFFQEQRIQLQTWTENLEKWIRLWQMAKSEQAPDEVALLTHSK